MSEEVKTNPLQEVPIGKLMVKFAVPSIIAMLVGALYNIVDQLFIGNKIGELGNAATNVAFPFTTACMALALLFGIGGASCFNLAMGEGNREKAPYFVGNAFTMLISCGTIIAIIALMFLEPLLSFFGAPEAVMPYAKDYVSVSAIGFPFLLLTTGGGHLIRADGSPRMTMICNITGALINVVLDALFILVFEWGMKGAALATIIGQIVSGILVIIYILHYKTVKLELKHFIIKLSVVARVASIGMGSFFNQIAMMIVQITLNNMLRKYGAESIYGDSIPIACAGIVMKVNQVIFSIVIGIAQGAQPIESFNYGAKNYKRVKKTLRFALLAGFCISIWSFVLYQFVPRQILQTFGSGSEEYYEFGCKFFRTFLFFAWLAFLQPITSTFFTSIGKPIKGIFLSLTRQIIFLLPVMIILPMHIGIDGILYAGPVADLASAIAAIIMMRFEIKNMDKQMTMSKQ